MTRRPAIAFVSREVAPFGGGGIGTYVTAAAQALAPVAEVKIFTTSRHRRAYEALRPSDNPLSEAVEVLFVAEPRGWEIGETEGALSLWSARAFDAVCEAYPDGGPDLLECPDYLGEGFVASQARRCGDPRLARTTLCVRACTTGEMTSVLDGHLPEDFETKLTHQIERYALANCDHFVWPGGDVLGSYERFFDAGEIAAPVRVRHPLFVDPRLAAPDTEAPPDDGTTRLLYVGRLERRKGVLNLARAVSGISDDRLRLTFLGGDTETAPLGQSVRAMLKVMIGDDPRVEFLDHVTRDRLPQIFEQHDAVVLPSLWECWPAVGLEALERNRPILATPSGGFAEIVQPGRSGWFTADAGPEALAAAIESLLDEPEAGRTLISAGGPREVFEELTDVEQVRAGYLALAAEGSYGRAAANVIGDDPPLVSIVIPYYRLDQYLEETVLSVTRQTYPRIETIVVNDGSFREADKLLERLSDRHGLRLLTQVNSGLGAARNAGIVQSRGRYVMFLDADNVITPTFIERCAEVLETDPELAYATTWALYIDERGEPWRGPHAGYRPLGNWTTLVDERNVAGDAAAVFRRSIFEGGLAFSNELTSFEDWALYRQMRELGLIGAVIPERLLEYRIRERSMLRQIGSPNQERIEGEIRARIKEGGMRWTAPS